MNEALGWTAVIVGSGMVIYGAIMMLSAYKGRKG